MWTPAPSWCRRRKKLAQSVLTPRFAESKNKRLELLVGSVLGHKEREVRHVLAGHLEGRKLFARILGCGGGDREDRAEERKPSRSARRGKR
jgi:hypothetical protein